MPAKRKRSGSGQAPSDGAEDTPVYKPHACRDDMQKDAVVLAAAQRLGRLETDAAAQRLRRLPTDVDPNETDVDPNIEEVRLLDTATDVTVLSDQTDKPKNRPIIYADDAKVLEMLKDCVQTTTGEVCSGACASRTAHDADIEQNGPLRWCPK